MIRGEYVSDLSAAEREGICVACGKRSADDRQMVRVTFSYNDELENHRTTICLCDECRWLLYKTI